MNYLVVSLSVYGAITTVVSIILGYKYWKSGLAKVSAKVLLKRILLEDGFTYRLVVNAGIVAHNKTTTIMHCELRHYANKRDDFCSLAISEFPRFVLEAGKVLYVELHDDSILNDKSYEDFCRGRTFFEVHDSLHDKPLVTKLHPPKVKPESDQQRQRREGLKKQREEMLKQRYPS